MFLNIFWKVTKLKSMYSEKTTIAQIYYKQLT